MKSEIKHGMDSADIGQREPISNNSPRELPGTIPALMTVGQPKIPTIRRNSLVVVNPKDKTRESLLIESKAVDVLQEALEGVYSYDSAFPFLV